MGRSDRSRPRHARAVYYGIRIARLSPPGEVAVPAIGEPLIALLGMLAPGWSGVQAKPTRGLESRTPSFCSPALVCPQTGSAMARPWPKRSKWPYVAKNARKSYSVGYYDHEKKETTRTFPSVRHAPCGWTPMSLQSAAARTVCGASCWTSTRRRPVRLKSRGASGGAGALP